MYGPGVGSGGGKVEGWKYCVNGDYNFRNGSGMAELLIHDLLGTLSGG